MNEIHILDNNTIDKIAAGEVVERPVSIVKELVENSIDAGATIITVEIRDGGMKSIRVTDNGCGIEPSQVRRAFLAHATSKINDSEDLHHLTTLGFRGEALSSIAAVSRVELTTKTADSLYGIHFMAEGGNETVYEEVGAPAGTTFIVRDIFYNTLPRLKFLKTAMSEGNLIADVMEHMALSMPEISFQFINNGTVRFSTSGHSDLREVIYRIFGKETASNLREIDVTSEELSLRLSGYLGQPAINRSNRSSEIFFVNHRYVKSPLLSRAVEEGYIEYLMQHKFPFCVLNLEFDPGLVDVNVHPTKQEVRISSEKEVSDYIVEQVASALKSREMLDDAAVNYNSQRESRTASPSIAEKVRLPESFEQNRIQNKNRSERVEAMASSETDGSSEASSDYSFSVRFNDDEIIFNEDGSQMTPGEGVRVSSAGSVSPESGRTPGDGVMVSSSESSTPVSRMLSPDEAAPLHDEIAEEYRQIAAKYEQTSFLEDDRVLSREARRQYRIIGQVFKTYWLIEYNDTLMIMDQHAAHEKVNFERFMARIGSKTEIPSQLISPPEICTLSNREMQILMENLDYFGELGFKIDEFGDHEIAIRSIPMDLFDNRPAELVGEIITDLMDMKRGSTPDSIRTRIATMACKASVKGNNRMSVEEVEVLLDEMLTLDNPYNCPHGRPTLITMSKTEMDKRFHRIV